MFKCLEKCALVAVLNKCFTPRHCKIKSEAPAKIWASLEKINGLLFFGFYNCGPFEESPGQMLSMPFLRMRPCWNSQVIFLLIKYLMLDLTNSLLAVKKFAIIH